MNDNPEPRAGDTATAEGKLHHLNIQVTAMRAVLVQLLQEVVQAEKRLDNNQATRLLQANEQLVIRSLEHQAAMDPSVQALDEVTHTAAEDSLSRQRKRSLLLEHLEPAIADAKRHHKRVAVLFLDLNKFKHVNDHIGQGAGDPALHGAALRMGELVRKTDTVSRHGNDELLIVLEEVTQAGDAGLLAGNVKLAVSAAHSGESPPTQVTASIGISIYPDDGVDAAALVQRANAALSFAKRQSAGGFAFCTHFADEPAAASDALASSAQQQIIAGHERRHAQLVEANEKLVLAALGFEALRDAASDARQLRDDLLGAVVKELDDPGAPVRLAAALSGLDTAHEALLPQAVKMVERQMEHMARTVATLLEPLQGAPLKLPGAQVVEMMALARTAVEDCRALIESRRQVLDLHLDGQPVGVHGHPLQLAQLLTRLLRNATDFTPIGGRISLHVQSLGPNVQLVVSDSGLGIERDALSTVLDPFVRDPRLRWDSGDSSGFGLTGVRAVVEAHSGSVAASSAGAGKGCQFTVLLPRVSPPTPG